MSKDLRQFLQAAKDAGPEFYVEVKRPLKPEYESCVIQEKLAAEGRYPVIYYPEIDGSKLPLVSGLFGSYEMQGLAFDMTPEKIKAVGKAGIFEEYSRRRSKVGAIKPKEVPASEAPVREVVLQGKDVDLGLLPIIRHYELLPAKYNATGMVISKDPDTGIPNIGVYRREVRGKDVLTCNMITAHHGGQIAQRYAELGKPMEVVTVIGHHPAVFLGAVASGQLRMNELELIGALLGEPLKITPGLTVDLPVPAYAEIVIEGVIDPNPSKMSNDGPFGEMFGYYGEGRCYLTQITAITMRRDAIYHDMDLAHPELNISCKLDREFNLYNKIKSVVPAVKAVHLGPERKMGNNLAYVSINKLSQG
ncbi:UbiD family decarboxylase domain-containing protein, partial [Chloroflexota bacterium]